MNNQIEEATFELPQMMEKLFELKTELKKKREAYRKSVRHLNESISALENLISDEVKKQRKTVIHGGIKAEYQENVVIHMKKENTDDK